MVTTHSNTELSQWIVERNQSTLDTPISANSTKLDPLMRLNFPIHTLTGLFNALPT